MKYVNCSAILAVFINLLKTFASGKINKLDIEYHISFMTVRRRTFVVLLIVLYETIVHNRSPIMDNRGTRRVRREGAQLRLLNYIRSPFGPVMCDACGQCSAIL